jgi:cytoskeletal protein RodZ
VVLEPSLGEYLQQKREEQNLPIERVASLSKINIQFLLALDEDRFDDLPARPYVLGFLRSYAKLLKVSEQELKSKFDETLQKQIEKKGDQGEESLGKLKGESSDPLAQEGAVIQYAAKEASRAQAWALEKRFLIGVLLVFMVAGIAVYVGQNLPGTVENHDSFSRRQSGLSPLWVSNYSIERGRWSADELWGPMANLKRDEEFVKTPGSFLGFHPQTASTAASKQKAPQVKTSAATATNDIALAEKASRESHEASSDQIQKLDSATTDGESTNTEVPAAEANHWVHLIAKEDAWIQFQEDDTPVREFILRAGEEYHLRGREVVKIFVGNLPGLRVRYNGSEVAFAEGARVKSLVFPREKTAQFSLPLFKKKRDEARNNSASENENVAREDSESRGNSEPQLEAEDELSTE